MIYNSDSCEFNKIFIAESLGESEPKTGFQLFNDVQNWLKVLLPGTEVCFTAIPDRLTLSNWLSSIIDETSNKGVVPLIHIEAHGSETGIALSSGQTIEWTELTEHFRIININTKNNLLLVIAACYGAHLIQIIDILKPSPVFGIIGPNIEVTFGEVSKGYQKFYQTLFRTMSLSEARKDLNSVLSDPEKLFQFHSAEDLFIEACINYFLVHHTAKKRKRRIEKIVTEILKSDVGHKYSPKTARNYAKKALREKIPDYVSKLYQTSMMLDKYPENKDRFELTFDQIKVIVERERHNRNL